MATATDELLRSPRLPDHVEQLVAHLRAEQRDRESFRQRLACDEDMRAEFINGEVVDLMSAKEKHLLIVHALSLILGLFVRKHKLGRVRTENALTAFVRNDYLPDICFWSQSRAGAFTPDLAIFPVPDFVVEVLSESTARRDRGVKFEDYAAQGVREYWIVDPDHQTIEQYVGRSGKFELMTTRRAGESIDCVVLQGLAFDVAAAFDEDYDLTSIPSLA